MKHVLHQITRRIALRAVSIVPRSGEADVLVEDGMRLLVVAFLRRWLVVSDAEVMTFGGVIFRTSQLIPRSRFGRRAHTGIYNARFDASSDCGSTVNGVVL